MQAEIRLGFFPICVVLTLSLSLQSPAFAQSLQETVVVEAGQAVGIIPAIHGMNGAPLLRNDTWQPPCGNNNQHDISETFIDLAIPQSRAHGSGPFDIDDFWIPDPATDSSAFDPAVYDPGVAANYDWTNSDEFAESVFATGVTRLYPRIGYSAHACNPPSFDFSTPPYNGTGPDRFDTYGQLVLQVLLRYTQGANGSGYMFDIREIEIWNEPATLSFWNGTVQDYHDLYMAAWNAVHNSGHPELDHIRLVLFLPLSVWGQDLLTTFHDVNTPGSPMDPIDAVASHHYFKAPIGHFFRVWNPTTGLEDRLTAAGYDPWAIPVYVSEWNRTIGHFEDVVPNGGYVAASLHYFALMHPANINPYSGERHNVVMTHFFSADRQAFFNSGEPRDPGVAFAVYAKDMVGVTPNLLASTGSNPHPMDPGLDEFGTNYTVLPGVSNDGSQVNVMLADYTNSMSDPWPTTSCGPVPGACSFSLSVAVNDLPWGGSTFYWERWQLAHHAFVLIDSGTSGGSTDWVYNGTGRRNTFELFRLSTRPLHPLDSLGPIEILLLVAALAALGFYTVRDRSRFSA
jgi:hypothetical protein